MDGGTPRGVRFSRGCEFAFDAKRQSQAHPVQLHGEGGLGAAGGFAQALYTPTLGVAFVEKRAGFFRKFANAIPQRLEPRVFAFGLGAIEQGRVDKLLELCVTAEWDWAELADVISPEILSDAAQPRQEGAGRIA